MTIRDIISLLDAEIISAADLDLEVKTACGSDMMSDVLAFVKDQSVLLTGLLNPQVVRTAEMMICGASCLSGESSRTTALWSWRKRWTLPC